MYMKAERRASRTQHTSSLMTGSKYSLITMEKLQRNAVDLNKSVEFLLKQILQTSIITVD